MKNPVKFVAKNQKRNEMELFDGYIFNDMSHKIAVEAQISPEIVKNYSKSAIEQWEQMTGRSVAKLYTMQSADRSANIYNILDHLRNSLSPIIVSVKTLDKTMCIASVSMELIFNP